MNRFYSPDEDIIFFNERYEKDEFIVMFEELNVPFSKGDILNAIKQLKTNRSGGPDRILNEFFIHGKSILTTTLCNLLKKKLRKGTFSRALDRGLFNSTPQKR